MIEISTLPQLCYIDCYTIFLNLDFQITDERLIYDFQN